MKLTAKARQEFLADHPDWTVEGESISRTFQFGDFTESVGFVVRVGFLAEAADHHPDIDVRWSKVTLVLSTHEEDALTEKDSHLAAAVDALV